MEIMKSCGNCAFMCNENYVVKTTLGECRRFPPVPVGRDGGDTFWEFPEIGLDSICGEWKPSCKVAEAGDVVT